MTRQQFNAGLIQELNFRKDHAEARITRLDSEIRAQLDRLPIDIPANRISVMRQLHAVQGLLIESQAERELIVNIEHELASAPIGSRIVSRRAANDTICKGFTACCGHPLNLE